MSAPFVIGEGLRGSVTRVWEKPQTTTHTAGPWTVSHDTDISGVENDPKNDCFGIVDVAHVYLREVPGKHEANARLIAAAPDLLQELTNLCELAKKRPGSLYEYKAAVDSARAAIAKATGGAA